MLPTQKTPFATADMDQVRKRQRVTNTLKVRPPATRRAEQPGGVFKGNHTTVFQIRSRQRARLFKGDRNSTPAARIGPDKMLDRTIMFHLGT